MYKVVICILIIAFTSLTPLAAEKGDTLTCEQLDSLIDSPKWDDRMTAALRILSVPKLDTVWAANTIIEAIKTEINAPGLIGDISTLPKEYSRSIIRQYIDDLKSLGNSIIPTIQGEQNLSSGKTKKFLTISLAFLASGNVHSEVKEMALKDDDPNIRMLSVISLGSYKDTLDIPVLLQASKDKYSETEYLDYAMLIGRKSPQETVFPVADAAYYTIYTTFGIAPDSASTLAHKRIEIH